MVMGPGSLQWKTYDKVCPSYYMYTPKTAFTVNVLYFKLWVTIIYRSMDCTIYTNWLEKYLATVC